jgi:hypothetical protein
LNYAAEAWGYHTAPDIERIHSKFCKKILGVKKSTNLNAMYGELNRIPMIINRKLIMIKYWIKILSTNDDSILYKTYKILQTDADNNLNYNKLNWAYQIKCILEESGLNNIWQNQHITQINFEIIKQRILDIHNQTWIAEITSSRRLETYCIFKNSRKYETYLDYIKESKYRIALTRFRTSSHHLAIEQGRYLSINRENRICNNCNLNLVESEFHFLLQCPKYSELRPRYIKQYFYNQPTLRKFINLLTSSSKRTIYNLAKFIYYANLERG